MADEAATTSRRTRRGRRDGPDHRAFLAEVATLYYVDKLNQKQISRQLGRSIAMVSRLLAEAHDEGIVEVRINHPVPTVPALQAELVRSFGLRTARVLGTAGLPPGRLLPRLGELAAVYLRTILSDDAIISVGWGTTLHEVARAVTPGGLKGIQVVQSMGSLGSRLPAIDNHLTTRLLADQLDGTPHYLHAPMIVDSQAVRDVLVQDTHIARALALSRRADVILFGIGVPEPEQSGLLHAGYLDAVTLETIRQSGAVGDICVTYFERDGQILDLDITKRVIGILLPEVTRIGTTILVARGQHKADAIFGALRTGFIHVLITDESTAEAVLARRDQFPRSLPHATSLNHL